jgi:hypothetical protein
MNGEKSYLYANNGIIIERVVSTPMECTISNGLDGCINVLKDTEYLLSVDVVLISVMTLRYMARVPGFTIPWGSRRHTKHMKVLMARHSMRDSKKFYNGSCGQSNG